MGEQSRQLANGDYLRGPGSGLGELEIDNGLVVDGVVAMTPSGSKDPVIAVYVRAKTKFTVSGVPDGNYKVAMTSGKDWDDQLGRFTMKCGFESFDEKMLYQTTQTQYSGWSISLHPVEGGTARTRPVSPDDFPNLSR